MDVNQLVEKVVESGPPRCPSRRKASHCCPLARGHTFHDSPLAPLELLYLEAHVLEVVYGISE